MLLELDGRLVRARISQEWEEGSYFNSKEYVSKATDSCWYHEALCLTEKGTWLIRRWMQRVAFARAAGPESWREISLAKAITWLITNGYAADALKFSHTQPEEV